MKIIDESAGVTRGETRTAIIEFAAELLQSGGVAAVTTRAVAATASVQAPTIYRLFGDKEGLLDAVAEHVFAAYVKGKRLSDETDNPVSDLDHGWDTHIGFGLANPALFALLSDPERGTRLPAGAGGKDILLERIHRVALAGRLRVAERRAADMIHAAGTGVVLTLLSMPSADRDLTLVDFVYSAVKHSIITDEPELPLQGTASAAIALRARLSDVGVLTTAEHALMAEWLDRIAVS